jgi:hypothetical protein
LDQGGKKKRAYANPSQKGREKEHKWKTQNQVIAINLNQ